MPKSSSQLWQWVVIGTLAVLGVISLTIGTLQRTAWLPSDTLVVTGTPTAAHAGIAIDPGVLTARDDAPKIRTFAADDQQVAFVLGRAADVTAWFDGAALATATGFSDTDPNKLVLQETPNSSSLANVKLPDPLTSDLFVQHWQGTGTLELDPPAVGEGKWLLVAVTDGNQPGPTSVSLTWPVAVDPMVGVPLLALGILMLASAVAMAWLLKRSQAKVRNNAPGGLWQSPENRTEPPAPATANPFPPMPAASPVPSEPTPPTATPSAAADPFADSAEKPVAAAPPPGPYPEPEPEPSADILPKDANSKKGGPRW